MSRREKAILIAAGLVLGAFLLDRFVLSPVSGAWEDLGREVSAREARLIHDRALLSRKDSLMKDYRSYAPGPSKTGAGEEKTALLKEIGAGARASGVKITDIKPAESGKGGVTLTTESSWESLASFLYVLQRSPHMLRVERASVRAKGEGAPVLTARLLVVAPKAEEIPSPLDIPTQKR